MGSSCPICFDDLKDKLKASPDICDHVFCLFCLEKWSKLGSYCPVDRKRYKKIINLDYENIIQVKPLKRKRHRIFYDISSICEVCSKSDKPDILLLCDCCDLAFHCTCLSPPLETVPAGQWFCPTCVSVEERLKKSKGITKENDFGIFQYDIASESEPEKVSKTESSSFKASGNIFDTCSDLISVFEEIDTVNRNIQKDANASNSNVDIENENVLKSFNYTSEVSAKRKSFIKSYKTYNKDTKPKNSKLDVCSNQCINKEKCVGANLDPRKSLDSNVSCNSDLLNNEIGILYCDDNSKINDKNQKHNVGSSMNVNEHILNEPNIQNLKSNKKITRTKLSLNKKKSLIFGINECDNSDVIRKKVQNYYYKKFDDDCHRKLYENFSVSIKNAPVNSKESVYLDTSKSNLLPSCSSSFKKSDEDERFCKNDIDKLDSRYGYQAVVMIKKIGIADFEPYRSKGKSSNSFHKSFENRNVSYHFSNSNLNLISLEKPAVHNIDSSNHNLNANVHNISLGRSPAEYNTYINMEPCEMCNEIVFRNTRYKSSICEQCNATFFPTKTTSTKVYEGLNREGKGQCSEPAGEINSDESCIDSHPMFERHNIHHKSDITCTIGNVLPFDYNDLKYGLKICNDGSLYLDRSTICKSDIRNEQFNSQLPAVKVNADENCTEENNIHHKNDITHTNGNVLPFNYNDLKCGLKICNDGSLYLDRPTFCELDIRNEPFNSHSPAVKVNADENCTEENNIHHKNDITHTNGNVLPFNYNDLKYGLKICNDGSLYLDCPTFCESDLRNEQFNSHVPSSSKSIKKKYPINKSKNSYSLQTSTESSSILSKCPSIHFSDLKHLKILKDGSFYLDH